MNDEMPKELVDRMADLCRNIWNSPSLAYAKEVDHLYQEACAIKVMLPEKIDPDLLEARELLATFYAEEPFSGVYKKAMIEVRAGLRDDKPDVRGFLKAIKHGRAIASMGSSG